MALEMQPRLAELHIASRNRSSKESFRETYAPVRDFVTVPALDYIHLEGLRREIAPYTIN